MFAKKMIAMTVAGGMLAAAGCSELDQRFPENRTLRGATIGTLGGAAAGAVLGEAHSGDSARGALWGALAGAAIGTGVGYYMERQRDKLKEIPNVQVQEQPYQNPNDPNAQPVNTLAITMSDSVLFAYDSSTVTPQAQESLRQVSAVLTDPQYGQPAKIVVIGHTDNIGEYQYNLGLSQERADAVSRYLVLNGVNPSLIATVGVGPDQPVASNATPEGRQMNRRVEIRVFPGQQ